jgi:ATP-binding cassette subfamily F protein 3
MLDRMSVIAAAHVDSQFHFNFLDSGRLPQHLLSLENVDAGYDRVIVGGVNLSIEAGSRVGLLGVNGAGKSTLLKTLVDGSTLLSGERTLHKHTRIGYFAQHQLELLREDCSPLWHVRQQSPGMPEQQLRNHLGKFGFRGERVDEPVSPFSGGEKARLVLAVLILQKPNLLLLDEPTNHLDLDMRQALSMALVEYSGALLVISHDRHLLRSVCDELFIVHDGMVSEFGGDLEEYSSWLKDQTSPAAETADAEDKPLNKKEQRQAQAQRRQQLQPQMKKVQEIERQMSQHRATLEKLVQQLADERLYSDSSRKDELAALVQQQGQLSKELESLEWSWLEVSEALEAAQSELD